VALMIFVQRYTQSPYTRDYILMANQRLKLVTNCSGLVIPQQTSFQDYTMVDEHCLAAESVAR